MADDTCPPGAGDASERIAELEDMVRRLNVRLGAVEGDLEKLCALLGTARSGSSGPTTHLRVVE